MSSDRDLESEEEFTAATVGKKRSHDDVVEDDDRLFEDNDDDDDDGADRDRADEDEEDEDEDEEEERSSSRKNKRRKPAGSRFIDFEVDVDDESDEPDDEAEDEDEAEEGFDEHYNASEYYNSAQHQRLDLDRERDSSKPAEDIAAAMDERHRVSYRPSRADFEYVPQSLLIPSVNDPKLWLVRCKPGKERDIVQNLMRKYISLQETSAALKIKSAFCRDSLSGYVYIESEKQAYVSEALDKMNNVYISRLKLVPVNEMADCLSTKVKDINLKEGAWVRIKRGKYGGDLAQVMKILDSRETVVEVKLIPRPELSGSAKYDQNHLDDLDTKHKKPNKQNTIVPPQRFFNPAEHRGTEPISGQEYISYRGELYDRDGYLVKEVKVSSLEIEEVNASLDEITRFSRGLVTGTKDGLAGMSIANTARGDDFEVGENVEVIRGELVGIPGTVESVEHDIVTVQPASGFGLPSNFKLSASYLRKKFSNGEHVCVIKGIHKDETGMIIQMQENAVHIYNPATKKTIQVFSKDVRSAKESSTSTGQTSLYDVHEFVILSPTEAGVVISVDKENYTILNQLGSIVKATGQQIRIRRNSSRAYTDDANGNSVTSKDMVTYTDPQNREIQKRATILHVYNGFVFLTSREILENGGVIVTRSHNVTKLGGEGPGSAKTNPMGPPTTRGGFGRGRGAPMRGRRDALVAKSGTITRGPYKGYLGIVKDSDNDTLRIELHTNSRVVTVKRDEFQVSGESGSGGWGQSRYNRFEEGGMTPRDDSGRTPMWGSRTPAYEGGGGRTPAGDIGARTPAWNAGSRTPAWDAGNRTPAYTGSRNSAWDTDSQTPSWNAGARTPARSWNEPGLRESVATPQDVSTPYNPSTPHTYATSTPGAARTPASYPNPGSVPATGHSSFNPTTPYNPSTPFAPSTPFSGSADYAHDPDGGVGSHDNDWAVVDIEVVVASAREFKGGALDGRTGAIRRLESSRTAKVVLLDQGTSELIPVEYLEPVRPEKKQMTKVCNGEFKDAIGTLIGLDGGDGIVKFENGADYKILSMQKLAKYCG
ncbi:uncharacterized protein BJ171DRAFT_523077 [Polychytrium aggregatum]|uniref:uncharacterized protein n=1 Tax=Polychytrium aggregatum TaxID=110093 RepID=UPI0022FF4479|nr:uncharacterized protein BJ171DRAFT_523077 [Polychytrium aggregatum]KAI9197089.1 hypothetical protein BJ171DRAFT_523077 [Polychytrium aggregatum]